MSLARSLDLAGCAGLRDGSVTIRNFDERLDLGLMAAPRGACSDGQIRTVDLSIMSRALLPTELRRPEAAWRFVSSLSESN